MSPIDLQCSRRTNEPPGSHDNKARGRTGTSTQHRSCTPFPVHTLPLLVRQLVECTFRWAAVIGLYWAVEQHPNFTSHSSVDLMARIFFGIRLLSHARTARKTGVPYKVIHCLPDISTYSLSFSLCTLRTLHPLKDLLFSSIMFCFTPD